MRPNKIKMKYMKLKNVKKRLNEKIWNLKQKITYKITYDFHQCETIRSLMKIFLLKWLV